MSSLSSMIGKSKGSFLIGIPILCAASAIILPNSAEVGATSYVGVIKIISRKGSPVAGLILIPVASSITNPASSSMAWRSEERRVGKECRYGWRTEHGRKNMYEV